MLGVTIRLDGWRNLDFTIKAEKLLLVEAQLDSQDGRETGHVCQQPIPRNAERARWDEEDPKCDFLEYLAILQIQDAHKRPSGNIISPVNTLRQYKK